MSCIGSFDSMCKRIICPTRHTHFNQHEIMYRKFKNKLPYYQVINVPNHKGTLLSVITILFDQYQLPTLIYLHGNGGHKMEALQLANGKANIISFDFGGCGKSQGEYLTYGQPQAKDVSAVVGQVRKRYGIGKVAVWGRSMGASIGIMYASLFPKDVSCLILDTPFRWLKQVVRNIAEHNNSVPNFILSFGMNMVQKKLVQLLGTNIFNTDFNMYLNLLQIPALFVYSTTDIVVKQSNVKELFQAYKGYKQIRSISAKHHEDRPTEMIDDGFRFIVEMERPKTVRYSLMAGKRGISMSLRGRLQS